MILCIGLSPAWQQIVILDQLELGAVNRFRECHWCASGKVLNAGIASRFLGHTSHTITVIGGASGTQIEHEFETLDCPATWVRDESRTRTCTTLLDQNSGVTTELVENAEPIASSSYTAFVERVIEQSALATAVVVSGSIPAGVPKGVFQEILQHVPPTVPTVLDIRGEELTLALPTRPWLIKPNREELEATMGQSLESPGDLRSAMQTMIDAGARAVSVSQGGGPVLTLTESDAFLQSPPRAEAVNPIGCGDCLAAGAACGFADGLSHRDAVRWGIAAAVDNLGQLLPARPDLDRVRSIASQVTESDWPTQ